MLNSLAARVRQARASSDAGITLMELVISMALMTLLGTMAIVFFVDMNSASSKTVDANLSTANARNALESWVSLIRLADSPASAGSASGRFEKITPTEVLFYADLGNRSCTPTCTTGHPTKIDLAIVGSDLVETHYLYANGAYSATPSITRHVATGITTNGTLFTPYVVGNPPTSVRLALCPGGASGLCTGTTGADAYLNTVVRIDIRFSVTQNSADTAQVFSSSASITGSTS